jgi:fatty-acyl-CoA synthase
MTTPHTVPTVGGLLRSAAARAGGRRLLAAPTAGGPTPVWSGKELLHDAEALAGWLLTARPAGSTVLTVLPAGASAVLLQLGAGLAGMAHTPVNPRSREDELRHMMSVVEPDLIVITSEAGELRDAVDAVVDERGDTCAVVVMPELAELRDAEVASVELPSVSPTATALLLFTSGTTGRPKAVRIRHSACVWTATTYVQRLALPTGSVWVNPMPPFHAAGSVLATLAALAVGAEHVALAFEPSLLLSALADHRANVTTAGTTMLDLMLEVPGAETADLGALWLICTGGSTVAPAHARRLERALDARFAIAYGMTETCGAVIQLDPYTDSERLRRRTVGRPMSGVEVRLADPSDGESPALEVGELHVRGPGLADGYLGDDPATAAAFLDDGWLRTGDLASIDDQGYVQIVGRSKEMIKTGGENVSPSEVESILAEYPLITRAAVTGTPDERWGEIVTAFVVETSGGGLDRTAVAEWCRERLSPHKVPRRWVTMDRLPEIGPGKLDRAALARLAGAE